MQDNHKNQFQDCYQKDVFHLQKIRWCFNDNKSLECMAQLAIHKDFIILLL